MKKVGLTFAEHCELGRNLRQLKKQTMSIHTLLSTKFGETKRFSKHAERIAIHIDSITEDMDEIVKNLYEEYTKKGKEAPPDIDNYYYIV